jgi:PAS domain S-box-containing protein
MAPDDTPRAAQLKRALLEGLMIQAHLGIGVCGPDGVLTMLNPALQDTLGAAYSPIPELRWASSYHLHDEDGRPLPAGRDPLALALHGDEVIDHVVSVRRPGGSVRWMRCNGLQLHDDSARLIGAAVFVVDVTARVLERRRLDALRDKLVETVNHEVRTPLATMAGHLELLDERDGTLPDDVV